VVEYAQVAVYVSAEAPVVFDGEGEARSALGGGGDEVSQAAGDPLVMGGGCAGGAAEVEAKERGVQEVGSGKAATKVELLGGPVPGGNGEVAVDGPGEDEAAVGVGGCEKGVEAGAAVTP
jgi:hypothetical protein